MSTLNSIPQSTSAATEKAVDQTSGGASEGKKITQVERRTCCAFNRCIPWLAGAMGVAVVVLAALAVTSIVTGLSVPALLTIAAGAVVSSMAFVAAKVACCFMTHVGTPALAGLGHAWAWSIAQAHSAWLASLAAIGLQTL